VPYTTHTLNDGITDLGGWANAAGHFHHALTPAQIETITGGGVDVATTSTSVLVVNSDRRGGWVQNVSDTDMWLGFGADAAEDTACKLYGNGGAIDLPAGYTGDVRAITPAGTVGTKRIVHSTW